MFQPAAGLSNKTTEETESTEKKKRIDNTHDHRIKTTRI